MKSHKTLITALCIALAGLLVIEGVIVLILTLSGAGSKGFVTAEGDAYTDSVLVMRDNIKIPDSPKDVQKRYSRLESSDGVYTLVYRKEIPEFFEGLAEGDIFCITADAKANESFFAQGFSGKFISKESNDKEASVSFTVPDITELFSDLNISLSDPETTVDSLRFIPKGKEDLTDSLFCDEGSDEGRRPATMSVAPALAAIKINELDADYSIKKGDKESLLPDYTYLCEELEFSSETGITLGNFDLSVEAEVLLEDLAVKSEIAYHTDTQTGQIVVDSYDIGVIANHDMTLGVEASVSAGLDDIGSGFSIIDFKDATAAEDGKMVLGTFLVGLSAPFLMNDTNKVSYLSLGIALQFCLTANGEISVECKYEQSGYTRIEADSDGNIIGDIKGPDYPNPVVSTETPTEEQMNSIPEISCSAAGEINLHAALGIDAGLCILGTVPIKIANNIIDLQYARGISGEIGTTNDNFDDETDIFKNFYILDDSTELFKVGITSFIRMNIGFESDLDVLNLTTFDFGANYQLLNEVVYQYPDPVGFSHAECNFGGIQLGDTYTEDEMKEAFKDFQKDTDQYSFFGSMKDSFVDSAAQGLVEGLDIDLAELATNLGANFEGYDFTIFSAGAIYFTDPSGKVVGAIISGDKIKNRSGFRCGCKTTKAEMLYSVPAQQASIHLDLGEYFEELLGIEEQDLTAYSYNSKDSADKMALMFSDGTLEIIVVYDEAIANVVG